VTVHVHPKEISQMTRAELIAYLSEQVAALQATGLPRRQARRVMAGETGLSSIAVARLVDIEHEV
jgi:hypothetical protein